MLWRAFKDIDRGFYIDVGAQDPNSESVTRAFYERGWRGINIEPVPVWHQVLQRYRPDDINLAVAAGDRNEERNFKVRSYKVRMRTLDSVLEEHTLPTIHFLKIDVEGAEESVIRGLNLQLHRPWIILVNTSGSLKRHHHYKSWGPVLSSNRYHFVYFDGLSRFYVADEKRDVDAAFDQPPKEGDGFETVFEHAASERIANTGQESNRTGDEVSRVQPEPVSVYLSGSWSDTKRLRFQKKDLKRILKDVSGLSRYARIIAVKAAKYIIVGALSLLNTRPRLKARVFKLGNRSPLLKPILNRLIKATSAEGYAVLYANNLKVIDDLPLTARSIYKELEAALRNREYRK